ncbi:MAG: SPASM domain-containing protein [Peptococcaceae bacterium]|nr:SPASM domain-containing protein [Peptococcaceae bacterium]
MKASNYNFIWPAGDTRKVMIFNSLTTSLAEAEKTHLDLLGLPRFDYGALPDDAKQFVEELKQGGFVLDDEADELKILKFAYNSIKYNRLGMGLTIAPTLRCNFACTYCYEQAEEGRAGRDGQNAFMPEKVQQELLRYIDQAANTVKSLFITWYGGEPLLAGDIIFGLSEKIIAIAEANKIAYSAIMITNGYLLAEDPDIVQKLKDSRIKLFQITLDGPPGVHNRRRMLKGTGGPTFQRILAGVRLLAANEMQVSLRVNVDRTNMYEALKILDILEENNLKDIHVYLGHVHADTAGCKSLEGSCATMEEFTVLNQTFRETLRQRGFKAGQKPHYPNIAHACGANRINSFVIDPDGDMYKCWHEIGDKPASIGNITGFRQRGKSERMREIRWLTWEPFESEECVRCKILPVCMGGCSGRTILGSKAGPDCREWKYSLEHYVRERFKREKAIKEAPDS